MKFNDTRRCAWDTETTGPSPTTARIVTAAFIVRDGDRPDFDRSWVINPGVPVPDDAAAVHGYTTERVQAEGAAPATAETRCGACQAPLIRQTGGVLDILADATPIPHGTDHLVREPNRLTWCRPTSRHGTGPPPLQWVYPSHPPDCPHPHHADHRCTAPRTPADPFEQAPPNALF